MGTIEIRIIEAECRAEAEQLFARRMRERLADAARLEKTQAESPAPNVDDGAEVLWSVEEVAKFLHVSSSWVYKQVELGKLPCRRVGDRLVRFEPAQVKAFAQGVQSEQTTATIVAFSKNRGTRRG